MSSYDELRIEISPVDGDPAQWTVAVLGAAFPGLPPPVTVGPTLTPAQVAELRNQAPWPDLGKLLAIGKLLGEAVLVPIQASFANAQAFALQGKRDGVRLVILLRPDATQPARLQIQDVPVEAVCNAAGQFLALDRQTPISRGVVKEADRDSMPVLPPLRILVVVSTPGGLPKADADAELTAILKEIDAGHPGAHMGSVALEVCKTPTRLDLTDRIAETNPHIIHFMGHGGFSFIASDPTPRPYILLDDGQGGLDPVDADGFAVLLKQAAVDVRLLVLTACSTAVPNPNPGAATLHAFDGFAQRLLVGTSSVTAVVAMQFEFEAKYAPLFSGRLYDALLTPRVCLDEAVTSARVAVSMAANLGHRAWVTPTVYWRCKDGRVFDLIDDAPMTPHEAQELSEASGAATQLQDTIRKLQPLSGVMAATVIADIEAKLSKQAELRRTCLRVTAVTASTGADVTVSLRLRLGVVTTVGALSCDLQHGHFTVGKVAEGPMVKSKPTTAAGADMTTIALGDVSGGKVLPPGDHLLATIQLKSNGQAAGAYPVGIGRVTAQRDGQASHFPSLDGFVYLHVP